MCDSNFLCSSMKIAEKMVIFNRFLDIKEFYWRTCIYTVRLLRLNFRAREVLRKVLFLIFCFSLIFRFFQKTNIRNGFMKQRDILLRALNRKVFLKLLDMFSRDFFKKWLEKLTNTEKVWSDNNTSEMRFAESSCFRCVTPPLL